MGGKCPHRKIKKRRYSHKTFRLAKFLVKGDDAVYDQLQKQEAETRVLPVDEDLPGMGQFYCLHCEFYGAILPWCILSKGLLAHLHHDIGDIGTCSAKCGPCLKEKDHGTLQKQHCEKRHTIVTKPIKDEEFSDAEVNPACTTSYASSGAGKSRQNLTEAEKEARRIRRVLANRESARQTIRRRQAIFEDLTRKAADLAWENENLKREMEFALKEFDSVKSTNESLKTQMMNMLKAEAEEIHTEIAPCPAAESPFQISNQPAFFPFLWPSIVQPSNPAQLQCGPQGSIIFPSPVPSGKLDPSSYDERNPVISNGSGTPLYVLPCPWFFPLPQQSKERPTPFFNLNDQPNETPQNNQYSHSSSAEPSVEIENQHLLPIRVKEQTPMSEKAVLGNKLHDNLFGFPSDGGGQHKESPRRGNVLVPIPLRCVRPAVVEHEKSPRLEDTCEVKPVPTSASDRVGGGLEKNKELMISVGKKIEGVVAAAKARKRRKELAKLKNLNCRQYRMQYVEKG